MAEKEYIDKVAFNYAIREAVKKYPNSFYNGLEVARQIAHDLPAADVRPVVRGFNVVKDYPSLFECSVCGWSDGDTTTGDTRTYNFCPNCGAKMEES